MTSEPYKIVNARFCDCDAGWIHLDLSMGDQKIYIRLSHVFDPIPDLIRWLEAILTDVMECAFIIDEEGTEVRFISLRRSDERLLLTIDNGEDEIYIKSVVHKRQTIDAFYHALKNFADSDEYIPKEWAAETLEDRIMSRTELDLGTILDQLAEMDEQELKTLLFSLDPGYYVEWPVMKNESDQFKKYIDYIFNPDNKEHQIGMTEVPREFMIDENYDSWSFDWKRNYIADYLKERADGYDGCDLKKIQSELIEQYLSK